MSAMAEMLDAAGCHDIRHAWLDQPAGPLHPRDGRCAHEHHAEGRRAESSWNQAWDVKNLFVTDGIMHGVSSAARIQSITYMALTARAAAHAVDVTKRGAL